MIVKCKSSDPNKADCPILPYCLARLSDSTITGCGLPLYMAGMLDTVSDIMVEYTLHSAPIQPCAKGRNKKNKNSDGKCKCN